MFRRELYLKQILVVVIVFVAFAIVFHWNSISDKKGRKTSFLDLVFKNPEARPQKCNVFQPDSVPENFVKAKLNYSKGTAVCFVHGSFDYVSNYILKHGGWEKSYVDAVEQVLSLDPSLGMIDLGCNVGVFTIVPAMLKRKVVAVDVNIENMKRVWKVAS